MQGNHFVKGLLFRLCFIRGVFGLLWYVSWIYLVYDGEQTLAVLSLMVLENLQLMSNNFDNWCVREAVFYTWCHFLYVIFCF